MEQNTRPPQKRRKVTRRQLRQRRIIGLLALLLIIFLLSSGCASCIRCACGTGKDTSGQDTPAPTETGTSVTTQPATEASTLPQEYLVAALPDSHQIPVDVLYQKPELPSGNEITCLTMVLNYLGFEVTKEIMANNFLTCAEPGNATFSQAFIGSPFDENGYGCLAPVIVDAAQKYLKSQSSGRTVKTLNVNSFDDILLRVASNHPVLVWVNQELELMQEEYCFTVYETAVTEPTTAPAADTETEAVTTETSTAATTEAATETEVYWIPNATCVVLTGYDMENSTVTVIDPTQGEITYDMEMFKTSYNALYKQAVIIY